MNGLFRILAFDDSNARGGDFDASVARENRAAFLPEIVVRTNHDVAIDRPNDASRSIHLLPLLPVFLSSAANSETRATAENTGGRFFGGGQ